MACRRLGASHSLTHICVTCPSWVKPRHQTPYATASCEARKTPPDFSMMTSSNGNIFRVTVHLCGEFTGPRWIPRTKASDAEIPRTKASDAELWFFFDQRSNKRLSKQWWDWWFETPSSPLWPHSVTVMSYFCLLFDGWVSALYVIFVIFLFIIRSRP